MARIGATTGSVRAEIAVGDAPTSIAVGEGAVRVGNEGDGSVSRIDPATDLVVATISIGRKGFMRLAAGEGRIWAAACIEKVVKVINPATNQVSAVMFSTVPDPWFLTTAGGALWLTTDADGRIFALDPTTGDVMRQVAWGAAPFAIAAGL